MHTDYHYSILRNRNGVEQRIISAKRYQSCCLTMCGRELAQKTVIFKRGKRVSESVLVSEEGETLLKELGIVL